MQLFYTELLKSDQLIKQRLVFKAFTSMQLFFINEDGEYTGDLNDNEPLDLPFNGVVFELGNTGVLVGVVEKGFNEYTFLKAHKNTHKENNKYQHAINWVNNDDPNNQANIDRYLILKGFLRSMLKTLNNCKTCEVPISDILIKRTKKNGKKRSKPIRLGSVIYIASDTVAQKRVESKIKRVLEWSISFRCRGHWRKVKNIGKNREGQYCIKGYTWVSESIKGNGPLINQLRVIKD